MTARQKTRAPRAKTTPPDYPHHWPAARLEWFWTEWARRESERGVLTVGDINELCREAVEEH